MTKFETIKAMSDKELGHFLYVLVKNVSGEYCHGDVDLCNSCDSCSDCWTNWLNKEANE